MARRIYNAKLWSCPRTFAEGADGFLLSQSGMYCHALALSYKDAYRRREIRDIFRDSRHPLLPERLAELAYRILISGFWLGSNKIVRRRGDTDICSHCGLFETTEHVFCTCDKAQRVWEHLLKWWYKRTSEHVAPSVRALLLGLRYHPDDDQDTLRFEELALPFLSLPSYTLPLMFSRKNASRSIRVGFRLALWTSPLRSCVTFNIVRGHSIRRRASGIAGIPLMVKKSISVPWLLSSVHG